MNHRIEIERKIIGACLHGYWLSAINILKPQNFDDELCRNAFDIVLSQHDKIPIDPITVSKIYQERHKSIEASYQITLMYDSCIGIDVRMYSVMLLELDMRQKFSQLLRRYESAAVHAADFESAAVWKQVADHITSPANDLFQAIDQVHQYLLQTRPDEVDEYEEMKKAIPPLMDKIKSQARFFMLIETLRRYAKEQGNRDDLFRITSEIFLLLLTSPKLPEKLQQTLKYIEAEVI